MLTGVIEPPILAPMTSDPNHGPLFGGTVVDEGVDIYNMDDVMWAIFDEFIRKRIPGADTVNVADYIEPRK